ncbi:lysozyme inhibitor LprI family protein [Sulfitobacter aestuarii]|uniref:Lysozyme inhibitor LprI family protein n=1 Tax=Sulfitobacter aestuarii TaxID=2161676 RepID=A0ABW5U1B2_9RHOB
MRYLTMAALAAFAWPQTGMAQAAKPIDTGYIEQCFTSARVGEVAPACISQAARHCSETTGGTTLDYSECLMAETAHWDAILNSQYQSLRADFTAQDADAATGNHDLAGQLLDAQRAWIAFRDADCGLVYAQWIDGSHRVIAAGFCHLNKTAQRAIELRDMGGE